MRRAHPLRPALQQAFGDAFPRAVACFVAGWLVLLVYSSFAA